MKNKLLFTFLFVLSVCCHPWAQTVIEDTTRVYDIVEYGDPFYLFFEPKPCTEPEEKPDMPNSVFLQEYVAPGTVTVYGVAVTLRNQISLFPLHTGLSCIHGLIMTKLGPSPIGGSFISMQTVDSVSLNHSHPRFCRFLYESDCDDKPPLIAPCYELYFDTPAQINLMTDTFYVGIGRDCECCFLPRYYGGKHDSSLPSHTYTCPGFSNDVAGSMAYDMFINMDFGDEFWGIAFPIIGFRCKPLRQYWLDYPVVGGPRIVRWRNAEDGTVYNVRLVGEDGSDTTFVTTDTTLVLPAVSDSVRYTVMLRKQCHYATSNYDTTVSSDWLSYISFGTTILPPDTTTRDTVWRTVTAVSGDPAKGVVYGGGVYADSSVVELTATPYAGCDFDEWSDGNRFNPRMVFVVSDTTLVARFSGEADSVGIGQPAADGFVLQPNPARGTVRIELPASAKGGSLSLCDMSGRELEVRTVEGCTMEWDVSGLAAGAYIVKLVTTEGIATRRLLVE